MWTGLTAWSCSALPFRQLYINSRLGGRLLREAGRPRWFSILLWILRTCAVLARWRKNLARRSYAIGHRDVKMRLCRRILMWSMKSGTAGNCFVSWMKPLVHHGKQCTPSQRIITWNTGIFWHQHIIALLRAIPSGHGLPPSAKFIWGRCPGI